MSFNFYVTYSHSLQSKQKVMEGFQCIRCGLRQAEFFVCHCPCTMDDIAIMRIGAVTVSSVISQGFLYETLQAGDGSQFHTRLSLSGEGSVIALTDAEFQKDASTIPFPEKPRRLLSRNGNQIVNSFFYREKCLSGSEDTGELFLYEKISLLGTHQASKRSVVKEWYFQYVKASTSKGSLELNPWVRIPEAEYKKAEGWVDEVDRLEEEYLGRKIESEELVSAEKYMEIYKEIREKKEELDEEEFREYVSELVGIGSVKMGNEGEWGKRAMKVIVDIACR